MTGSPTIDVGEDALAGNVADADVGVVPEEFPQRARHVHVSGDRQTAAIFLAHVSGLGPVVNRVVEFVEAVARDVTVPGRDFQALLCNNKTQGHFRSLFTD